MLKHRATCCSLFAPILSLFVALLLAACAVQPPALSSPASLPAAAEKPVYTRVQLSPDGAFLAALTPYKNRQNVVVMDLGKRRAHLVTGIEAQDVAMFWWANNNRLLFTLRGDGGAASGLFAVNKDGSRPSALIPVAGASPARYTQFAQRIPGNNDEVVVLANERNEASPDVYRLNVNSGRKVLLTTDKPDGVQSWVLDHRGVVRVAMAQDASEARIFYRRDDKSPWTPMVAFAPTDAAFAPVTFAEDDRTLYVLAPTQNGKASIRAYDPEAKKMGATLFELDHGALGDAIFDPYTSKLLGFKDAGQPSAVWLDAKYQRLQAQLDGAIKGGHCDIRSTNAQGSRFVVYSLSSAGSGAFYLFDTAKLTLEELEFPSATKSALLR
jgi:hypothetical protein